MLVLYTPGQAGGGGGGGGSWGSITGTLGDQTDLAAALAAKAPLASPTFTTQITAPQIISTGSLTVGAEFWHGGAEFQPGAASVNLEWPTVSGTLLTANGNGSALTALNASQLTSGTVPAARIAGPAVTQTSHGFILYDAIRHNGTTWVKAQANSAAGATGVRLVTEVINASNFRHADTGVMTGLSLTAATQYYLSPSVAGSFTAIAPTATGHFILPLFATSTTAQAELNIGNPVEITGGGGGGGGGALEALPTEITPVAGVVTLALSDTPLNVWLQATSDLTFSVTGLARGRLARVIVLGDAVWRRLTWPGWRILSFASQTAPASLLPGVCMLLECNALSANAPDFIVRQHATASSGKVLAFSSVAALDGLAHWLGTLRGTAAWTNPHTAGYLTISASSSEGVAINTLVDRSQVTGRWYTSDVAGSWVAVDIGAGRGLVVSAYVLGVVTFHTPRNWKFQASVDGSSWTDLATYTANATMTAAGLYVWDVSAAGYAHGPARYFRILLTGLDSQFANRIELNEIELYGELID